MNLRRLGLALVLLVANSVRAGYTFDWDGPTAAVPANTNYNVRADVLFSPNTSIPGNTGFIYTFYRNQASTDYTLTSGSGGVAPDWTAVNNPTVFNDAGGQTIQYRIQVNSYGGETDVSYYPVEITGPTSYGLTIDFGTVVGGGNGFGAIDGFYPAGTVVSVVANTDPQGRPFSHWTHDSGPGSLGPTGQAQTTFTMGAGDATIEAHYYSTTGAPSIAQQPASQTVPFGQPVLFAVTATGTSPLTYQWRKDGINISGATSPQYSISAVNNSHLGGYSVVVSNAYGTVTSSTATLTIETNQAFDWGTIPAGTNPGMPSPVEAGVGALAASVSVDNRGAANASIPLKIPPGRAGLQPSLAIVYNSNGGNGPLGIGWSLSTGFPQAITRGRTILARDGGVRGVNFTVDDKFYLDGKRLLYTGGASQEGAPGSTYRTEVDSFVTVTTSGTGSGVADWNIDTFVVTDKGGVKMTFGKLGSATDAYHKGSGANETKAYAYALKQVEDTIGNKIVFSYAEVVNSADVRHGEYVLSQIRYTDFEGTAGPGVIDLHYNFQNVGGSVERLDRTAQYIGGRYFARSRRLDAINVTHNGTRVAYYTLGYDYAPDNGPLRLSSVTPYLHKGTGSGFNSFPATNVTWSDGQPTYAAGGGANASMPAGPVGGSSEFYTFADVTGDGVDDLIDARDGAWLKVQRGDGTGNFSGTAENWLAWTGPAPLMRTADFNGDGKKDLLYARTFGLNGQLHALLSNGNGFIPIGASSLIHTFGPDFADNTGSNYTILSEDGLGVTSRIATADFTGDGRDDVLIHRYDGQLRVLRSDGTGFTVNNPVNIGADPILVETIVPPPPQHGSVIWPEFLGIRYRLKFSVSMMPCELNGDGIADYAWVQTENEWKPWEAGPTSGIVAYGGKTAFAVTTLPTGGFSARTSFLTAANVAVSTSENYYRNSYIQLLSGDVNGDGLTDFLTLQPGDIETVQGQTRKVVHPLLLLSKGNAGLPTFAAVESGIDLDEVVGGVSVKPYFDPLSSPTWYNNSFHQIGNLSGDMIGMFMGLGLMSSGDNVHLHDVNQDGRADYLWYVDDAPAVTGWWVMYSEGMRFSAPVSVPATRIPWTPSPKYSGGASFRNIATRQPVHANGDGIPDYASYQGDSRSAPGVNAFHLSSGQPGVRVATVTDGLGRVTSLQYKPVTDPSVYTPGVEDVPGTPAVEGVKYPIRELRNATYVVSQLQQDSGGPTPATFAYQYSGHRLDLSGRGGLGFHAFVTLDLQTKVFKYQFLAQSFPMTGLTHRDETYRQTGTNAFNLLTSHDNVVVFDRVAGGEGTLWPFISRAVEYRWEDGAAPIGTAGSTVSSDPENVFKATKPLAAAHIAIAAESRFDNQGAVVTTLPAQLTGAGYSPSDTSGTSNTVVGSESAALFTHLPGNIDRGNLRLLTTDFGDGFSESVETTYKPVTSNGLSGLVDTVTTTVVSPAPYGAQVAPIKSFTYWSKGATPTPLVATETIDAPGAELDLTTTYTRDTARGRVTATTITGFAAPGMGGASVVGALSDAGMQHIGSFVASEVTSYNDVFDLPLVTKNAAPYGHTTTTAYHPFLGLPTSVTGPNGTNDKVSTEYDALGRVTRVIKHLSGEETQNTYDWDSTITITPPSDGVAPNHGITGVAAVAVPSKFRLLTTTTARPSVTTWFDRLGRPLRVQKQGFGAQLVNTDTGYNTLGQAAATTLPYPSSSSPLWTHTRYDALGRVRTVSAPNGTVTTSTYAGRGTSVEVNAANFGGRDPAPQVNATVVDAKGRTVKVWNANNVPTFTNNLGGTSTPPSIEFKLDGFGRMRKTLLKDQTPEITAEYDAHGRQIQLADPDKGTWNYVNNAFGQVVKQVDARLNVTRSTFDRLGRPLARETAEPSGPVETATWHYYDTAANTERHLVPKGDKGWIGALQREESATSGAPGYAGANSATSRVLAYNAIGLPEVELTAIDGKMFHTQTTYDANARPWKIRHYWKPAGAESPNQQPYVWQDFGYTYAYDIKSYVTSITDTHTPSRIWWDNPDYDHLDRVTSVRKGSGHTTSRVYRPEDGMLTSIVTGSGGSVQNLTFGFDGLGNLVSRNLNGVAETFDYDILNRLTHRGGAVIATYADNGNILTKKAVDDKLVSLTAYHASKPHAVIGGTYDGKTLVQDYDANGNVSARTFGTESWDFRYAGFDKPRWMAKTVGGVTTGSEFLYNASRSRTIHLEFDQMASGEPSHYVRKRIYAMGPTLELNYKNTASSGATWALDKVRIYVPGPDGTIGAREWDIEVTPGGGEEKAVVYHYDHLGSIESITPFGSNAATLDLDETGKPGRFAYDPWGQRRLPSAVIGTPSATDDGGPDSLTPRGFTGHEMLDGLGLVHMNGRLYDALIGRFVSPDPIVDGVGDRQGYNRYAYVQNRPLSLYDPSGNNSRRANQDQVRAAEQALHKAYERELQRAHEALSAGDRFEYTRIMEGRARRLGERLGYREANDPQGRNSMPQRTELRDANRPLTAAEHLAVRMRETSADSQREVANVLRRLEERSPKGKLEPIVFTPPGAKQSVSIHGKGQQTSPGHASTSEQVAAEMAVSGQYVRVHLNQRISTITGGTVNDRRQPDVAGVRRDGRVDAVEVPSASQSRQSQQDKIDSMTNTLGILAGPGSRVEAIRPIAKPAESPIVQFNVPWKADH